MTTNTENTNTENSNKVHGEDVRNINFEDIIYNININKTKVSNLVFCESGPLKINY